VFCTGIGFEFYGLSMIFDVGCAFGLWRKETRHAGRSIDAGGRFAVQEM
jgi:hypothetical protein